MQIFIDIHTTSNVIGMLTDSLSSTANLMPVVLLQLLMQSLNVSHHATSVCVQWTVMHNTVLCDESYSVEGLQSSTEHILGIGLCRLYDVHCMIVVARAQVVSAAAQFITHYKVSIIAMQQVGERIMLMGLIRTSKTMQYTAAK